jgi:hypothetical protein
MNFSRFAGEACHRTLDPVVEVRSTEDEGAANSTVLLAPHALASPRAVASPAPWASRAAPPRARSARQ